jgi:protein-S-isoprenylcysteine O-methyltransferase Ste14
MMPLAYTSWVLFLSFGGDWAELGFGIGLTGDMLPLGIVVLILAIIIFFAGVTLFIWGIIHIVIARKNDITIIQTGPYKYIRHPQHLGIILSSLPFVFLLKSVLSSAIRLGFRYGDLLSWILFCFILIIWSDIEERNMQKKYPEEFAIYKSTTGFYFPKIRNKEAQEIQAKRWYYYLSRYLVFFSIYCGIALILYLISSASGITPRLPT